MKIDKITASSHQFPNFSSSLSTIYNEQNEDRGMVMINRVVLTGRLTRDPELQYSKQGIPYAKIRIAVNRNFKNGNGEQETDFIDCTVWRKSAETVTQYCKKGSLIGVTGRIQTSSYTNQEGKRMYRTDVSAENVTFLERKKENASL